jgi:hypothetical protein
VNVIVFIAGRGERAAAVLLLEPAEATGLRCA